MINKIQNYFKGEMGKGKTTHVARGTTFGDVSNQTVRNILSQISKEIFGNFTADEMKKTMEYFDWCCPYTGNYLKDEYDRRTGNYATDHIYCQCNRRIQSNS